MVTNPALRTLRVEHSYSTSTVKSRVYIHRIIETWKVEDSIGLTDDVSKTLNNLNIDDLNGTLNSDDRKRLFIQDRFVLLTKALSQGETSEKLRLAGRWLFDSYCGKNELLSFLQTTVCPEILLGDKAVSDLMGLSELLRNRCVYLIGKTHAQREEVLKNFGSSEKSVGSFRHRKIAHGVI